VKLTRGRFINQYVLVFLLKSTSLSITISTLDLVKRYHSRTVVNHVSIEVNQGEIVGLLGPNGAGKTTTFYQVVGLIKPDEGDVFLNGENITSLPMYKRARMGIGYLPQEASVFRKLSVENNIAAVLEMSNLSKAEQKEKIETLLDELRLHHVRKSNGDLLSGGERRRTEIARALAVDPKFMLLDEPFAGIDPIAVEDIQSIVAKLKYKNIGILITDHNVTETLSICDRAYLLIEGKIFKQGTAEELAEDEQVRKLYLEETLKLKRKDWLHEEARSEVGINLENLIGSVENALAWNEKIIEANTQSERSFGHQYISTASTIADLGLDDYSKFLLELKQSLIQYGKQNKNAEILERANKFLVDNGDINTDLNTILLFLKGEQQ
jgi:lipopolysaccharide export system ATP-binding protein